MLPHGGVAGLTCPYVSMALRRAQRCNPKREHSKQAERIHGEWRGWRRLRIASERGLREVEAGAHSSTIHARKVRGKVSGAKGSRVVEFPVKVPKQVLVRG